MTTLLIVDDHQQITSILKEYAEQEGYQVFLAEDGEAALQLFNEKSPDLLLLDVMMPKKNGFDVCREIRQSSNVRIHRDKDANGFRTGDKIFVGSDYGINQHSTTIKTTVVGDWSAGCLVGREWGEHLAFLSTVKSDVRYTTNANYEFVTAVIPGDELSV